MCTEGIMEDMAVLTKHWAVASSNICCGTSVNLKLCMHALVALNWLTIILGTINKQV